MQSDRIIADSGWRPSVDLQASTGFYDTQSPSTNNQSVDYDSTTLELSVTQNLFNGYDTTYQIEQTEARKRAALYEIYDTADNVALRAIQAYLEVLKQRRLYQLALDNVAAHEEILGRIRERNLSGVGRRSQLQQTEGRLARAQASLIAQQNNLEDASTTLHQVLGRYVDPQALTEPEQPVTPQDDLDILIDRALAEHPAMRVAQSNVEAAQFDYRRSLKSRYPNIDLQLATEYGDDVGGLDGNTEETRLVLNLNYNFYRGGSNRAEQQKKISTVYEQKEFAARVRRQVINSLRLSWTANGLLTKQLEFLQTHVSKAAQTVESYKEEFFIAQRDLIDLLDAENELNSARNQFAEASYDALGARFRVQEGMGALLPTAGIAFQIEDGRLNVARLQSEGVDKLPIPNDEDRDNEIDPSDHCDNSLPDRRVDDYGCQRSVKTVMPASKPPKPNQAPVLLPDRFEIEANGILLITAGQLLENDSDAESDSIEIVDVSQPEFGRLAFNSSGNLVYRPAEGYVGEDTFTYTATDNRGAETTATTTATVVVRQPRILDLSRAQLVNFVYDGTELTEVSKSKVRSIIEQLKLAENVHIEIYTYTDDIGSEGYNMRLSSRRAEALRELLIDNGIDAADISARGMGEASPIADNSSEAGQAINRRGEFIFRVKTPTE